jgi:hypothetical protein
MSKHFKFSLEKTTDGRMARLKGDEVNKDNVDHLHKAYLESNFHYQFNDKRGCSRIMSYSTSDELLWIEEQIKKNGSVVTIYPNRTIQRPVYHRDA